MAGVKSSTRGSILKISSENELTPEPSISGCAISEFQNATPVANQCLKSALFRDPLTKGPRAGCGRSLVSPAAPHAHQQSA